MVRRSGGGLGPTTEITEANFAFEKASIPVKSETICLSVPTENNRTSMV
jgi:hypothetical protein